MENLIARLSRTGFVVLVGIVVIIGGGLGFVLFQQGQEQRNLEEQIRNLETVLSRPLPAAEELQTNYQEANLALAPMTRTEAIAMLVGIARESGIDVDSEGKFDIPPASITIKEEEMGGGSYQVLSFSNIRVQGDYANVMAFIDDLDSGKTLETMGLKNVDISQVEVEIEIDTETEIETETETETETVTVTVTTAILRVDIYTTKPAGGG